MKKDLLSFNDKEFDLAIVGAGIHGAVLAREAAKAGYKVALVEMGDFGHSTSANSLKIVQSGLGCLQRGDFRLMRESVLSRRAMMRFAPHLVKPLACLRPTYGHGGNGRELIRLGFGLHDLFACDRNKGLSPSSHLPGAGVISASEVKWVVPGIDDERLTGGAVWYDAIVENTERLVLEYIKEAVRYGAVVANYVKATKILELDGRLYGLKLSDRQRSLQTTLMCRAAVNATGPWLGDLQNIPGQQGKATWASAINIVVRRKLFKKYAVALENDGDQDETNARAIEGRRLLFVPWRRDYTLIGTRYELYQGAADDFRVGRDQVRRMLAAVNRIYPAADLTMADVSYLHGGLLPLAGIKDRGSDTGRLEESSRLINHQQLGGPSGLYAIQGGQYTTAPAIARKVLRELRKNEHLTTVQKGAYVGQAPRRFDFGALARRLGGTYDELVEYLQQRYGGAWRSVLSYQLEERCLVENQPLYLSNQPCLLASELLYFVHEEMASRLADVVLRRSELGSAECPPPEVLARVAAMMAAELEWSKEEEAAQVADVLTHYGILRERG